MDGPASHERRRIAVIMAGGSGERFWPLSRSGKPKQLLNLAHPQETLIEQALARVKGIEAIEDVYIATTRGLRDAIVAAHLVPDDHVLAEPVKRNTLGCLSWVSASLVATYPDDWRHISLAILTADHNIRPPGRFARSVEAALATCEEYSGMVTIGIRPSRPETGYGYIEVGEAVPEAQDVFEVEAFKEKPYQDLAEEYVGSGNYLWNSGMFFCQLESFFEELREADPSAYAITMSVASLLAVGDEAEAERQFADLPSISIDYALLERSPNVFVVRGDFEWDDVGSLDSLYRTLPGDEDGNIRHGKVVAIDSAGSIVYNDDPAAVTCVLGAYGLVVVVTKDAVLVCPKHETQRLREIVAQVREGYPEHS